MDAINLKDIKNIYLDLGNNQKTEISSIWYEMNIVWPALDKPIVDVNHMFIDNVDNFMISISWNWVANSSYYYVYVDNVKVAEVNESWDQGEHGYWEGGEYTYGTTHDIYVVANSSSGKAQRMSDVVSYKIDDDNWGVYNGTTIPFEIVASETNAYNWTSGNNIKLYAAFPRWLSSEHLNYMGQITGDYHVSPACNIAITFDYATESGGSGMQYADYTVSQYPMDNISVYPATLKLLSGPTKEYEHIILLDQIFIGQDDPVIGWTLYTQYVSYFDYWNYNNTKYRLYPQGGVGGSTGSDFIH